MPAMSTLEFSCTKIGDVNNTKYFIHLLIIVFYAKVFNNNCTVSKPT